MPVFVMQQKGHGKPFQNIPLVQNDNYHVQVNDKQIHFWKRKVKNCLLDLSVAFDTVNHNVLLERFEHVTGRDRLDSQPVSQNGQKGNHNFKRQSFYFLYKNTIFSQISKLFCVSIHAMIK